ncbi:uncharacterized protein LOC122249219 [Penaeus japonicus]|uniref:uncharacterized protein LOC122249219 n=1 Tax=Penaeus japonicus TaxID=27405 RepID=UPI001C71646B|nr:uncharacterized protein LOC122249219 [Penaeus japonicus]XP_042865848.1 uncharacterized protein LOC122249219 [Penaeus japonicus]
MAVERWRLVVVVTLVVVVACVGGLRPRSSRFPPLSPPQRFQDFRIPWKSTLRPRWESRIWFDPRYSHNHRWDSPRDPAHGSRFREDLGDVFHDRSDRLAQEEDFYRDVRQDSGMSTTRTPIEGLWEFLTISNDRVEVTRDAENLAEPLGSMSLVVTAASLFFIVMSMAGVSARTLPSLADIFDNIQAFLFPENNNKEDIAARVERAVSAYEDDGRDPRISSIVSSVANELQPVAHRLARQFDPFSQIAISAAMVLAAYVGYAVINPKKTETTEKTDGDITSGLEHLFLEDTDANEESVSSTSNIEEEISKKLIEADSQKDDFTQNFSQSDFSSVTAVSTLSDSKKGTLLNWGNRERPSTDHKFAVLSPVVRPHRKNNRFSVKYQSNSDNYHFQNANTNDNVNYYPYSNSKDVSRTTETYPSIESLFPDENNQPDHNDRFSQVTDPLSVIDIASDYTPDAVTMEPMNLYSLLTSDKLAIVDSSSRNKTPVPFLYSSDWSKNHRQIGTNAEKKEYHVINNSSQDDTPQYNDDYYTVESLEFLFKDNATDNVDQNAIQTVNPQRIGLFPTDKSPPSVTGDRLGHENDTMDTAIDKSETFKSDNTQKNDSGPSFFQVITSGYHLANVATLNTHIKQEDQPEGMDGIAQQVQHSEVAMSPTHPAQDDPNFQHTDDKMTNYMQFPDGTLHNPPLQYEGMAHDPQLLSSEDTLMQQSEILNYLLKEIAMGHLEHQGETTLQNGNTDFDNQQIADYPVHQSGYFNHNFQGSISGHNVQSGTQSHIPQQSTVLNNQENIIHNFQLEQSNQDSTYQQPHMGTVNYQQEGITGPNHHHQSGLLTYQQKQNAMIHQQQNREPGSQENDSGVYYQIQIVPNESSSSSQHDQAVPSSATGNNYPETHSKEDSNNNFQNDTYYALDEESIEAFLQFAKQQLATREPDQVAPQVDSDYPVLNTIADAGSRPYRDPVGEFEELSYVPGGGYTSAGLDFADVTHLDSHGVQYPGNGDQTGVFPEFDGSSGVTVKEKDKFGAGQHEMNAESSSFGDDQNGYENDITKDTAEQHSYDELELLTFLISQKDTFNRLAATEDSVTVNDQEGAASNEHRDHAHSATPAPVYFLGGSDHETDHKHEYLNRGSNNNKDADNEYVWTDQKIVNNTQSMNKLMRDTVTTVTQVPESLVTWVIPQKISTWSTLSDGRVSLVDEGENGATPLPVTNSLMPSTTDNASPSTTTSPPVAIYAYDSASAASAHLTELPSVVKMSYPSVAPAILTTQRPPPYHDPTRPRANGKLKHTLPDTTMQANLLFEEPATSGESDTEMTEILITVPDEGIFNQQSSIYDSTIPQHQTNPFTAETPYTPPSITKQTRYLTTTPEIESTSKRKPMFTIGFSTADSSFREPTHEPAIPNTATPPSPDAISHDPSATTSLMANTVPHATSPPSANTVTSAITSSSVPEKEAVKEVLNAVSLVNRFLCRHAVNEEACVLCLEEVGIRNECYSRRP